MRHITVVVILAMARPGCADSAAATVVISAPVMAKNTVGAAPITATQPRGVEPPHATRWAKVGGGNTAVSVEIGEGGAGRRRRAERERSRNDDKYQNCRDFDGGEPEFKLGIRTRRHEVDARHDGHQTETDLQLRVG